MNDKIIFYRKRDNAYFQGIETIRGIRWVKITLAEAVALQGDGYKMAFDLEVA